MGKRRGERKNLMYRCLEVAGDVRGKGTDTGMRPCEAPNNDRIIKSVAVQRGDDWP
jgi:hypothetical protein